MKNISCTANTGNITCLILIKNISCATNTGEYYMVKLTFDLVGPSNRSKVNRSPDTT
jgi:hypothetical protein